jgi:hypothetical protein
MWKMILPDFTDWDDFFGETGDEEKRRLKIKKL